MKDNKVIKLDEYKAGKSLDGLFDKFLDNAEKVFGTKMTTESMVARIYCTLRYLEGHLRMIKVSDELGIPINIDNVGKAEIRAYMISLLEELDKLS
jgi:hypothetical protein